MEKFILMFKCLLYDFYRHKNSLRVFAYMRGNFLVFVYLKTIHISFFNSLSVQTFTLLESQHKRKEKLMETNST